VTFTLQKLADSIGATVKGDASLVVDQVCSAERAEPGKITFINEARYIELVKNAAATAVIATQEVAEQLEQSVLVHPNPYLAYAKVAQLLNPRKSAYTGVHPSAWVADTAVLAEGVVVGPQCSIAEGAVIGTGTVLQAGVVVEEDVVIGEECWLSARVSIGHHCVLGDHVALQAGAVIGSDGFGFANEEGRWLRIPQIGRVIIGNNVEIGANTCIDRGAIDDTVIADGVILDNLIQIAHNVSIGENTAMAAMSGVAGSTKIGEACTFAGMSKIIGHLEIAAGTHVAVDTLVTNNIKQAGAYAGSLPMDDINHWRKNAIRFKQLDAMAKRIKQLEKKLDQDKRASK
jgi:UDP-3-O-[3-hydroxymyristoyl] glucosamine N-acyltransferase